MGAHLHNIHGQPRVIPVRPENCTKTVTKLENGNLRVEQQSGNIFEIAKDDEAFQAFLIFMILNEDAHDMSFDMSM